MDQIVIKKLTELEAVIQEGLETFYKVGAALQKIRDERLWELSGEYTSFDDYCLKRWQYKPSSVYHYISAAKVAANLPEAPAKAAHVTPLKVLTPENQRLAWEEVTLHNPDISMRQVEAVATKYRLVEKLGENHWIVRNVNDGVVTAKYAWDTFKTLESLPEYYATSIDHYRVLPASQVLLRIRTLESKYESEAHDILRAGYLDNGKEQINLGELTIRDIDRFEARLYYENLAQKQLIATEIQKVGLPIYDGAEIFDIDADLVYLFPAGAVNTKQLGEVLVKRGYQIFMVIGYKNDPKITFGPREEINISQVNGVKPDPIIELIKNFSQS